VKKNKGGNPQWDKNLVSGPHLQPGRPFRKLPKGISQGKSRGVKRKTFEVKFGRKFFRKSFKTLPEAIEAYANAEAAYKALHSL
jgi:hypothetical protein